MVLVPGEAVGFGTVNGFFGQNGEHERIARAALACPAGTPSDGTCFEPVSMQQIAGEAGGAFGAAGAPDFPPPSGPEAHCEDGDFLDTTLFPKVTRDPQKRAAANAALLTCRAELAKRFRQGRDAAPPLLDPDDRIVPAHVDSSGSNTQNDPGNLRIAAAAAFNAGLVSAAEAGPGGRPDRSAVIDFDNSARLVSSLGDPDAASFAGIDSSGGTNIASGVDLSIAELTRDPADPTVNRAGIVILTDGEDSDRAALVAAIGRAASLGIRVSFGFLAPPSSPVPATMSGARQAAVPFQSPSPPPADLVAAIVASGGVFSTIDSAAAQQAFVSLVETRGATNLDDPNGADDGGPLASGVSTTAVASAPGDTDTFSGRGADTIAAGAGDDIVLVGARDGHRGTERISGGPGNDVVEFEAGRRRTVTIPAGRRAAVTNGRARFELRGVEVVLFGQRR